MSILKNIEAKLFYLKIMKKLANAFTGNAMLHSAYMAVLGAVGGACYPFLLAYFNSQPIPTIKVILLTALKAGGAALLAYIGKNMGFGGAGVPTTTLTQSVTSKPQ